MRKRAAYGIGIGIGWILTLAAPEPSPAPPPGGAAPVFSDDASAPPSVGAWDSNPSSQLIFFAVLEGLYRDGVSSMDVDRIIPPGEGGRGHRYADHFVYACPLCHPAFEAFRLYRSRQKLYGLKSGADTFGSGLPPDLSERLKSSEETVRLAAIQGLIQEWVAARIAMMRLSEAERASLLSRMEAGRKRGMEGLKRSEHAEREGCAICEGSVGAARGAEPDR